jgi:hypothetical protein
MKARGKNKNMAGQQANNKEKNNLQGYQRRMKSFLPFQKKQ